MTTTRIPAFAVAILASRLLLAPPQYAQEITSQAVSAAVDRTASAMIEVRHQVHQHPELSNREFETSKLVAERLRALGLEVQTGIAHTGVVGILKGGRLGPVVAVRSELDALPVTEDTDLPFKSTVRSEYNGQPVGVAHACGHDIHIATILGVATVLSSMREQLPGTVIFIFQPAEEGPPAGEEGGAKLMLKEGIFSKLRLDAVFGLHATAKLDVGQILYSFGPTASADTTFKIEFHGKQSHAAFPQEAVDPVVMASEAVMQLQTIRSRNISPFAPAVLSITMIHAGVRNNIIPETATLAGTIRVFDDKVEEKIEARMKDIVDGIARGANGSVQIDFDHYGPVLISDPALVKRMLPAVERAIGAANVHESQPVMASDDFAYFAQVAPAFFFELGTQKPGTTSGVNHAPNFRADDSSIPVGMRAMTNVLVEYLQTPPPH
jgi:amidohydrolase